MASSHLALESRCHRSSQASESKVRRPLSPQDLILMVCREERPCFLYPSSPPLGYIRSMSNFYVSSYASLRHAYFVSPSLQHSIHFSSLLAGFLQDSILVIFA